MLCLCHHTLALATNSMNNPTPSNVCAAISCQISYSQQQCHALTSQHRLCSIHPSPSEQCMRCVFVPHISLTATMPAHSLHNIMSAQCIIHHSSCGFGFKFLAGTGTSVPHETSHTYLHICTSHRCNTHRDTQNTLTAFTCTRRNVKHTLAQLHVQHC